MKVSDQRQQLRDALDPDDEAGAMCIFALDGGASLRVFDGSADRDNLVTIYARRVGHLRREDARTIGSDDLVRRLQSAEPDLRLAVVTDDEWHFSVFLDAATRNVVAVWAIDASLGNSKFNE